MLQSMGSDSTLLLNNSNSKEIHRKRFVIRNWPMGLESEKLHDLLPI